MFRTRNGIGRAAMACFRALQSDGLDPIAVDLSGPFNQAECSSEFSLSQMPRTQTGTLLLYANGGETEQALMALGLRRWHDWRVIGCWAWELPTAPPGWQEAARHLSDVWVPSGFVEQVFRGVLPVPVHKVPHHIGVSTSATHRPGRFAPPPGTLQVLTIADGRSSFYRKNITGAVEMFRCGFGSDSSARLILKCRNLSLYPDYKAMLEALVSENHQIQLVDDSLNEEDNQSLLMDSDILLSPHHAEGFGMSLAEAMAASKVVVATGWSGNLEFMSESDSMLIPYTLVPVDDPSGTYRCFEHAKWARPDIRTGANMLEGLKNNFDLRAKIGNAARMTIARKLPHSVYSSALKQPAPLSTLNANKVTAR